jgi:hypothetical protein
MKRMDGINLNGKKSKSLNCQERRRRKSGRKRFVIRESGNWIHK